MQRKVGLQSLRGAARMLAFWVGLLAAFIFHPASWAQEWPTERPVKLIVAYPPGGPTDIVARLLANELQAELGGTFVVENRAGAGGTIGTRAAAKAPGDGYTLILTSTVAQSINTTLLPNVEYDPVKDFTHISLVSQGAVVFVVNAHSPFKNFSDLLDAAKAKPGSITYGSAMGSVGHLTGELVKRRMRFQMQHVPYKGGAPAQADLLGGHIHVMPDVLATHADMIKMNRVRVLAVAATRRIDTIPDVPTFAELGYGDLTAYSWFGLSGPANIPTAVVEKLETAVQRVLAKPEIKSRIEKLGMETTPGVGSSEYTAFVTKEVEKWGSVIRSAGIRAQ